jgi:hypothetical protein
MWLVFCELTMSGRRGGARRAACFTNLFCLLSERFDPSASALRPVPCPDMSTPEAPTLAHPSAASRRRAGNQAGERAAQRITLRLAFTGAGALRTPVRSVLARRLGVDLGDDPSSDEALCRLEEAELAGAGERSRRRQLASFLEEAFATGADWKALASRFLGELTPGAARVPDCGFTADGLAERLQADLRRAGVTRWSELLDRQVADLRAVREIGPVTLAGVLGACFGRSLEGLVSEEAGGGDRGDDLAVLLRHERQRRHQRVLEALLEARAGPVDGATAAHDLERQAAERLLRQSAPWALSYDRLDELLLAITDERDRAILEATELASDAVTLSQLAAHHGVSAPRVAQRRDRAAAQLRAAAQGAPAPLPWLLARLRRSLGRAVSEERASAELARLGIDTGDARSVRLVHWLAGPFERVPDSPGWMAVNHRQLDRIVDEQLGRDGGVAALTDLAHALEAAGVVAPMVLSWLRARGVVIVEGGLALRVGGTLVDAAERLLEALARPASCVELEKLLAEGGRRVERDELERTLRGRRFRAAELAGEAAYGLASWGGDARSSPPAAPRRASGQQVTQKWHAKTSKNGSTAVAGRGAGTPAADETVELEQRGGRRQQGEGHQQALVPGLLTVSTDPFDPGRPGRRDGPSPEGPSPPGRPPAGPTAAAGGEAGAAVLEVLVDERLLSGGEAPVPSSLVDGLGVGYRQRRTFASRFGPVALANDGAEPVRGPLRPIALAAGARLGDMLRLCFAPGGSVTVEVVGPPAPGATASPEGGGSDREATSTGEARTGGRL